MCHSIVEVEFTNDDDEWYFDGFDVSLGAVVTVLSLLFCGRWRWFLLAPLPFLAARFLAFVMQRRRSLVWIWKRSETVCVGIWWQEVAFVLTWRLPEASQLNMFTSALLQPHRSDDVNVADGHDEGRKDESHHRISEHHKLKIDQQNVTSRKHIFIHHWLAAWVWNLMFLNNDFLVCKNDVSGCEILRGTWRDLRLRDHTVYVHRALHKPDLKPVDM